MAGSIAGATGSCCAELLAAAAGEHSLLMAVGIASAFAVSVFSRCLASRVQTLKVLKLACQNMSRPTSPPGAR